VPGLTFALNSTTTTPASVVISRDSSALSTKLNELVTAYNDFNNIIAETTNPKSTLETYGATLVGNSTMRMVQQQMKSLLLGKSSTAGSTVSTLGEIGLSVNEKGVMSFDETKASSALQNNYDDVVKLFSGGYNNLTVYSNLPAGIAGDGVKKLTNLLSKSGPLVTESDNATNQNTKYQADLEKLQKRLDSLLARYNKQFSQMESFVGSVNSQKASLKSTFEGMMANLTNK